MASVKKFPGSRFWYACYTLPDGTRRQRSTGLTEYDSALQVAISYEKAARLARQKRFSDQAARRVLAEIAAIAGGEAIEAEPVEEFLGRWARTNEHRYGERSAVRMRGVIDGFLGSLGKERAAPLHEVTSATVARWRDGLLAGGRAAVTVNSMLSFLNSAFGDAVRAGLLERNPAEGLRVREKRNRNRKRRPFTFEQFAKLVGETGGEWQGLILLAGYTGARQQECAQLRAGQVDFDRGVIAFRRGKSGDWHEVPMHPVLARWLKEWLRKRGKGGQVFPELAALPQRRISRIFREQMLPKIDIEQPYGSGRKRGREPTRGRVSSEYTFHSLRHSLSTWLNAAGVSDVERQRIVGHESAEVSRGYTHAGLEEAKRAVGRLPALGVE